MENHGKNYSTSKTSLSLLIVSGFFFFLNFAMGDTILGNVIVLLVSLVTGVASFLGSALRIKGAREPAGSIFIAVCAGAIVLSICILAATDNIAMGYGP